RLAFGKDATFRELKRDDLAKRAKDASRRYDEYFNVLHVKAWEVLVGGQPAGWFATDAVIGKVEKIDYAVALDANVAVQQVFILKYRESHGQEIKRPSWLAQFPSKSVNDALRLN